MGIKELKAEKEKKRPLKLSRRSAKVRKALDKSYLRNLKSKKAVTAITKTEEELKSRRADNDDVRAPDLFYEEMGLEADIVESEDDGDESDVTQDELYEKEHKGLFRHVSRDNDAKEGDKNKVGLLPIKIKDKVVEQEEQMDYSAVPGDFYENDEVLSEDEDVSLQEESETSDEDGDDPQLSTLTEKQKYLMELEERAKFIEANKIRIAWLSQTICEDPETNIKYLTDLVSLLNRETIRSSTVVTQLLLLSVAEVFKDIVPGYKIRELSAEEKKVRVKKDTKKLRNFEEILLRDYQSYLKHMEAILKGKFTSSRQKGKKSGSNQKPQAPSNQPLLGNFKVNRKQLKVLRFTVAKCVGTLLINISHFNFRTNLVRMASMLATSTRKELAEIASDSISQVFISDRTAEVSLEIMFYLDKILVGKAFSVHSCCLNTFLSLPITEVNYEKIREYVIKEKKEKREKKKQKSKDQSRIRRKASKIEDKWVRELDELNLKQNKERINFLHGKIIGLVFACYFRVLKSGTNSKNLEVVLEGVSKLGHLIGVEFYDDLLVLIQDILKKLDLTYKQRLHCVLSVFRLMTGDLELVNVDLQQFYSYLYESLLALCQVSWHDFELALSTIEEVVLRSKREMRPSRLHALCKRLTTLLLAVDSERATRIFPTISRTLSSHSDQLLTEESVGTGRYCPYVNDPDFANAQNTALWELHLLKSHYCSDIIPPVRSISQLKPVSNMDTKKKEPLFVYMDRMQNSKNGIKSVDGKVKRASLKNHRNLLKIQDT